MTSLLTRSTRRIDSEPEESGARDRIWRSVLLVSFYCVLLSGCSSRQSGAGPFIEFDRVPLADKGGYPSLDMINGRVIGAHPRQQIVLYARSGAWYVQPKFAASFAASFAADVDYERAAFMADSQVPWGVDALNGTIREPAWKTRPSWYLVATDDKMIPPTAQRFMSKRAGSTVVEVAGSHAIYVSQPNAVAALIEKAASEVKVAAK